MISGTSARLSSEIARQSALSNDIGKLQDQISSTKKLSSPSDDPVANARVGAIRRTQADDTAYTANVNAASAIATKADSAMSTLSSSLDRARELVTAAANGTQSGDDSAAAAIELRSIAQSVTQLAASTDSRGQALFPDGEPLAIPIADGVQVQATVSRATLLGTTSAGGSDTDIAAMLNAAADAVTTTDDATRATLTTASLGAITGAVSQVADVRADQGLRAARIDAQGTAITTAGTALATERSGLEDTDVSAAISLITSKMTTLQAAQGVFAKLSKQTLFDVLG